MDRKSYPLIVLLCGIGSWLVLPLILSIAAWILGNQALNQPSGFYSDSEMTMIQIGRILGIVNVILGLIGFCFVIAAFLFFGGIFLNAL